MKGLGRLPAVDNRDSAFLLKSIIPKKITRTSRYWNASGWWGDQQYFPHCVGYSWAHWVEDGPVTQKGIAPIIAPQLIYAEAQKIDEWEGENYDGTSVRAGAKYLQSRGVIESYLWAWDVPTLVDAVLTKGPVVVGTNWYDGMFEPKAGLLNLTGDIAGGHAYIINGVNTKTKLFRMKNSWGRSWGRHGFAFIRFDDMEKLIALDGEICLAIEKKL